MNHSVSLCLYVCATTACLKYAEGNKYRTTIIIKKAYILKDINNSTIYNWSNNNKKNWYFGPFASNINLI